MKRTSLTQTQARRLAAVLKPRRRELQFSIRELAARAAVSKTSVETLERGTNLTPQPETIRGIAEALGLSTTDLMMIADWLPPDDLPSLRPYLRAKYGLDDTDIAAVDAYLVGLQERHAAPARPVDHGAPPDRDDQPYRLSATSAQKGGTPNAYTQPTGRKRSKRAGIVALAPAAATPDAARRHPARRTAGG